MKVHVKAHPKSSKVLVLAKDESHYDVWVREAPDKGKANQAVIDALSAHLGVPRSKLSVTSGLASRNKTIEIGQ